MVKVKENTYILGIDNGYQYVKTADNMFDNGVSGMGKVEPTVKDHSLKYERNYYKVGEGRAAITEDKVSDENARLLTMVAIAKELSTIGVTKADIILAVGLPFSDYGREKKSLIEYYNDKKELRFEYEGVRYSVNILQIFAFPQCYAAIAPRLCNMKGDYLIIDVGSKTTDVVYLENGTPIERRCITIEKAMVKWMKQAQANIQIQYGKNIPESEIIKIIINEKTLLPKAYVNTIRDTITEQVQMLALELKEREYDLDFVNTIYVGGGAVAVKNHSASRINIAYDCDIHSNAKGYEFLAQQMLKYQGVA